MDEALIESDRAARLAALDPRDSILLEAPAGSGKTAVLAQRFLRLLCTVEEPGAILAITFTLKAAAEMRGRVLRALAGETAADDPCAPQLNALAAAARQHGAARGWNLREDPGALRIQTIDAFNYWLASQLPLAARVGGVLAIDETPGELYQRAARRTLAADGDPGLAAAIGLLFERVDNHWAQLERMLAQMLAQRGHWLRYVLQHEPHTLCARIAASLADVVGARLQALRGALPRAARAACEALPGVGDLSAAGALAGWQELAHLTLTDRGWRQVLSVHTLGEKFAAPARRQELRDCIAILKGVPQLEPLLRESQRLPAPLLSARDRDGIAALAHVLAHAAGELQAQFAASGRVDYTYVSGAAREALTETSHPTELALRTGLALRHILVDEFQDTSLAQSQLLESLTAAWEPDDGRTLFVVGDPMQSIYRFRDAEVGLFLARHRHGAPEAAAAHAQLPLDAGAHRVDQPQVRASVRRGRRPAQRCGRLPPERRGACRDGGAAGRGAQSLPRLAQRRSAGAGPAGGRATCAGSARQHRGAGVRACARPAAGGSARGLRDRGARRRSRAARRARHRA
jgi:ATP-dependent helicase/nuclease subunit A